MVTASFPFVISEALLGEYGAVLLGPRLRKLHGLSQAQIETLLIDLAQHAIGLKPAASGTVRRVSDADVRFLCDLLASRDGLLLVIGDKLLLKTSACKAAW